VAALNKLTAAAVRNAKPGQMLGDGGGLWLQTQRAGQRSWLFRYSSPTRQTAAGKSAVRDMGLGSLDTVSLAAAREKAAEARLLVSQGRDPLDVRDDAKQAQRVAAAKATTFKDAAAAYIAAHAAGWRSPKHGKQWTATLATYAYPTIGDKPVAEVGAEDVRSLLEPVWTKRTETANRVRGRIEAILDYAVARSWRAEGLNPARWRGHLDKLLARRSKVSAVEHHAALDWREAPAFMRLLEARNGMGVLALRFAILTAARSGEVRAATWGEIDLDGALWTVPGARMKAGREHRVPLSNAAVAVLREVAPMAREADALIFPGMKHGVPMSDMTLTAVLRRMGRGDLTVHGFRSTFRDWAGETGQPGDVAEAALAHTLGSAVQRAYQRGDMLERRRALMVTWAEYLAT